jgi:hypothetical protein
MPRSRRRTSIIAAVAELEGAHHNHGALSTRFASFPKLPIDGTTAWPKPCERRFCYRQAMGVIIGRCNGAVLLEDGKRVSLVQQPGEHLATVLFVSGLATVVLGANGAMQLFMNPFVGVALLVAAALTGTAAYHVKRRLDARAQSPVREAPHLVFDFAAQSLMNGSGVVLAPLSQVMLRRRMQLASSSRALHLELPNDSIVIARGNPLLGDHVGEIEDALHHRGMRVAG